MMDRAGRCWLGRRFAKLCNKPLSAFDQDKDTWLQWNGQQWDRLGHTDAPVITHRTSPVLWNPRASSERKKAIEDLFSRSFD
jgi:hypothetical protein